MVVQKANRKTPKASAQKKSSTLKPANRKSAKTAVQVSARKYFPTFFQLKLIIGIMLIILSYRYPLQAVQDQEMLTLVLVSFLLLAKPSPFYRLMKKFSHPKLMFVLIFAAFIVPTLGYANTKYLDWDNAQMIKGLAHDFPELVEQIEQATGLDLVVSSNCMTTTEKFSSGVKTCEFLYVLQTDNEEYVKKAFTSAEESSSFVKISAFENGKGYRFKYRNQNSCSIANTDSIYGSCIIGVRDQNIELAKSMFTK